MISVLPLVNGYFHALQVTSELFSCLLKSTPVSQKHLVQNQNHTAVQHLYESSDFGGSTGGFDSDLPTASEILNLPICSHSSLCWSAEKLLNGVTLRVRRLGAGEGLLPFIQGKGEDPDCLNFSAGFNRSYYLLSQPNPAYGLWLAHSERAQRLQRP